MQLMGTIVKTCNNKKTNCLESRGNELQTIHFPNEWDLCHGCSEARGLFCQECWTLVWQSDPQWSAQRGGICWHSSKQLCLVRPGGCSSWPIGSTGEHRLHCLSQCPPLLQPPTRPPTTHTTSDFSPSYTFQIWLLKPFQKEGLWGAGRSTHQPSVSMALMALSN